MEREQNTNDKKEQRKKGERQPSVLKPEDSNENGEGGMGERYLYGNAESGCFPIWILKAVLRTSLTTSPTN